MSTWLPLPRKVLVSGSGAPVASSARTMNPPLYEAIETLSAAAYGRTPPPDTDLDEALNAGAAGIRVVARRYTPWARAFRSLKQSALGVRDRAWAR